MSELLDRDAEGWARLQGLMAVLALPPVHNGDGTYRRRQIEIETKPGSNKWVLVDGVALDAHLLVCWWGSNGTRQQYVYERNEQVPRWRFAEDQPTP